MAASIELTQSDIAQLRVDAIVNAANEALQLGSGVAGAIRTHGGPTIQAECDLIGTCAVGQAVVTKAGKLHAKWIIHAVGPVWKGGNYGEEMLLASAVLQALRRGEDIGAASGQRDGADQGLRLERTGARAAGEPVARHRREHRLHVLRQHHVAAGKQRPRARGTHQALAGARRETEQDIGALARARHQRVHVLQQRVGAVGKSEVQKMIEAHV